MSGTIHLTEREQTLLTAALDLERAGFQAAARYLRDRIAALRPIWTAQDAEDASGKRHLVAPEDLLRIHHGSNPPLSP